MIAARDVEVSVFDGPALVQRWPCSATTMADGSAGVIWRGTPYPLLPGDRIDIGASPPAAGAAHVVMSGAEASWVLIQGTQAALRDARAALARGGMVVARAGRWLGEPAGGTAFDWYLRVEGPLDAGAVATLLGEPAAPAPDASARTHVLEQRISSLLAEAARLRQPAAWAEAPEERSPAPVAADPTPLHDALRRLAETSAELERLRAPRPAAPAAAPRLLAELRAAFQALRPDLVLLRGSLTVAVGEYPSRAGFYRAIQELLPSGARPEGWKLLRGADRWWERHVSTGRDDAGRLYARFDTERRAWSLLLGWKSDQPADIAWLRNA